MFFWFLYLILCSYSPAATRNRYGQGEIFDAGTSSVHEKMNVYCNPQLIVIHGHEFARTTPWETRPSYLFKTIIMRNYLLSLLVALLAVTGSLPMAAQKAYAVLTPDDGTLTFYYDNQRDTRQNSGGIYDMPRPGVPPAWTYYSNDPEKNIMHVMFDTSFFGYRPTSTSSWFGGCINLQDIKGIRNLNTEHVTDMSYMFYGCEALTSLDVSKFNTQNVREMRDMFYGCEALTSLNVSNFNTEKVTDMRDMFYGCEALTSLDVSNFNTQNVTEMIGMFYGCQALTSLDVSKFNTQNVTSMSYMFYGCEALTSLNVSKFNTEKVTDMRDMFYGCQALTSLDVSKFNTQNVGSMSSMFANCQALTSLDVSKFNTQNVREMDLMFYRCEALKSLDVSKFNTQNVANMESMFQNCKALTSLDVSKFKTQNVTNMESMFQNCKALTSLDVSKFKTQKVTDMSYMFYGCTSLATIFCNSYWEAGHKVNDKEMFYNCTQLKGTNTSFDASRTGIEMANPTTGYFTSKTTGIDHVKTADQAGDGKIYDLSGRRVNESYKGIVIKNGKKYIQK